MYALEQISLQGMATSSLGNSEFLNEKNDLNSQNGLVNECKRMGVQLKQLQLMEKRTSKQVHDLRREETEILGNIQRFRDLEVRRDEEGSSRVVVIAKSGILFFRVYARHRLRKWMS